MSLQLGGCLSISAEELDSFKVIFKLTPLRAERDTPWDFLQLVQGSQGCARGEWPQLVQLQHHVSTQKGPVLVVPVTWVYGQRRRRRFSPFSDWPKQISVWINHNKSIHWAFITNSTSVLISGFISGTYLTNTLWLFLWIHILIQDIGKNQCWLIPHGRKRKLLHLFCVMDHFQALLC